MHQQSHSRAKPSASSSIPEAEIREVREIAGQIADVMSNLLQSALLRVEATKLVALDQSSPGLGAHYALTREADAVDSATVAIVESLVRKLAEHMHGQP